MRYKHDCSGCISLGEFNEFDLYFCPQNGIPTVVARYGDDGPDYTSGLEGLEYTGEDRCLELKEAKRRAIEKGLL